MMEELRYFWNQYLDILRSKGANIYVSNPMEEFSQEEDYYGSITNETHSQQYERAKYLAQFWKGKPEEKLWKVMQNAFMQMEFTQTNKEAIVNGLSGFAKIEEDAEMLNDLLDFDEFDDFEDAFYEDTPFDENSNIYTWTPRMIYDYISHGICGQEQAKRAVSMLVYQHLRGNSRNILMAGPTGSGKTEIWRILSKKLSCIKVINGPQLSCDGWKGSYHVKDIFWKLKPEEAEHLIIVVDEADKLFEPMIGSGGTDFAHHIQNELLKIMDGDTLTFVDETQKEKNMTVDCTGVSMVFVGSFEHMLQEKNADSGCIGFNHSAKSESEISECTEEDLVQYANIRREIAGRINQIVTLNGLTADDFKAIMDSTASPIVKIEQKHNVKLTLDEDTRNMLAEGAVKSGMGCRYIRSKVQALLDEKMFDYPSNHKYQIVMHQ